MSLFLGILFGVSLFRYYVDVSSQTKKLRRVTPGVPTFKTRGELGKILERDSAQVGVELGVQTSRLAERMLQHWRSCQLYVLGDVWAKL